MSNHSPDPSDAEPDEPVSADQVRRDVRRSVSMDLDLLRVFIRVADAESLSVVADGLGCAPSDIRRRMAVLERRLGARLLVYGPRRTLPTTRGSTLLPYLRVVLATVDALRPQKPPESPRD
jgi:DNA-binding transcriptional LysR family regulator